MFMKFAILAILKCEFMALSTFTASRSYCHHPSPELIDHPKLKLCIHSTVIPYFSFATVPDNLYSDCLDEVGCSKVPHVSGISQYGYLCFVTGLFHSA